jgi:hypothetical protein
VQRLEIVARAPPDLPGRPALTTRDLAERTGLTEANVRQKRSRLGRLVEAVRQNGPAARAAIARLEEKRLRS